MLDFDKGRGKGPGRLRRRLTKLSGALERFVKKTPTGQKTLTAGPVRADIATGGWAKIGCANAGPWPTRIGPWKTVPLSVALGRVGDGDRELEQLSDYLVRGVGPHQGYTERSW